MPTWDWKCPQCEKVVEKFMKSSDPNPVCDVCEISMEKLLSSTFKIRRTEPWLPANKRMN